jgi:hypothetical protein
VQLAFCWSHIRRRFYQVAAAGPAPIATETLERIANLYAIEKDIRGRNADERRAIRQDRSRPIIDDLEPWLRANAALASACAICLHSTSRATVLRLGALKFGRCSRRVGGPRNFAVCGPRTTVFLGARTQPARLGAADLERIESTHEWARSAVSFESADHQLIASAFDRRRVGPFQQDHPTRHIDVPAFPLRRCDAARQRSRERAA